MKRNLAGCLLMAVVLFLGTGVAPALGQGVTADSITIGVTSAFKGHAASLGSELYRGYMAYFERINGQGGVNGRRIKVVAYDDAYDPPEAVKNTIELVTKDKAFLLFGNVGTPTTTKVLPLLLKYKAIPVYMFSPFTGAQPQREDPYQSFCINVRASYRQETAELVDFFVGRGSRRVGLFYQNDAYGASGKDGVLRALTGKGMGIAAEATYTRGATFEEDMSAQVKQIVGAGSDAIVSVGAYQACAAFVRDARKAGFKGPIANISFVGSDALLGILDARGRQDGRSYTEELYNSQVVPSYEDLSLPLVKQYREDMARYAITMPPNIRDPNYTPAPLSFGSLEGYINAVVLVKAIQQAGEFLGPDALIAAIESMKNVDIGIGSPLNYSPTDHQGLDAVYLTVARDGKWVPVK